MYSDHLEVMRFTAIGLVLLVGDVWAAKVAPGSGTGNNSIVNTDVSWFWHQKPPDPPFLAPNEHQKFEL